MAGSSASGNSSNEDHRSLHELIFLLLLGVPSLDVLRSSAEGRGGEAQPDSQEIKKALVDRTTNINIVATLMLTAVAAFLTTSSPTNIMNWNHEFPYLCLLIGGVLATLSVLSGLGLLGFVSTLNSKTVKPMVDALTYRKCNPIISNLW
ncbi:hypothetical protein EDD17DRAFT_1633614 [Pisolithus thermaeus]|nr:hypothetical protein EV401DRAFT_2033408 [Pisolithus croceorrhizus]KAI6152969.1 hypothetical protein EDD17DRAFT_1633614 [Pisolithus thermaeus]